MQRILRKMFQRTQSNSLGRLMAHTGGFRRTMTHMVVENLAPTVLSYEADETLYGSIVRWLCIICTTQDMRNTSWKCDENCPS